MLLFLLFVKILIEIDTNIVLITEFGEKSLKLLDYSHHSEISRTNRLEIYERLISVNLFYMLERSLLVMQIIEEQLDIDDVLKKELKKLLSI